MKKKAFNALRLFLAVAVLAMSIPLNMFVVTAGSSTKALDVGADCANTTLTAEQVYGDFTVKATDSKTVAIDENEKTDETGTMVFSKRMKLGGAGDPTYRSVHFTTAAAAQITVYAMSSSGTADRPLSLYKADGTLVSTQTALGTVTDNKIPQSTYTVTEAGTYYLASDDGGINIYYIKVAELVEETFSFNASDGTVGDIPNGTIFGEFTVTADASHAVSIDANAKTSSDGTLTFTQRLKLGGAGTAAYRSVHFATEGEAEITVYAISSSSSADRPLALFDTSDDSTISTRTAMGAYASGLEPLTYSVTAAGDYYLASTDGGINIYYISVTQKVYGGDSGPARPAWADATAPTIDSVTLNGADTDIIDVAWTGDISNDGADRIFARLIKDGEIVVSSSTATAGTTGTLQLTPPSSGDYVIRLDAVRTGETDIKSSADEAFNGFVKSLEAISVGNIRTTAVSGTTASLIVEWSEVDEATHYTVEYKTGADPYTTAADNVTDLTYTIPGLTVGTTYDIRVTAVRGGDSVSDEASKEVAAENERWMTALVGSGAAGTFQENGDGSITINATGGKIADSEDGFSYYYTEVDPETENFTLTATFYIDDASNKDNQSGFGIIAIDTFEAGNSNARYFNSAGTMFAKYSNVIDGAITTRYGVPGGKFVTGYSGAPTASSASRAVIDTSPFDWNFKSSYTAGTNLNPPKFETGETYTLTLRKSNTGFHSTIEGINGEIICYEPELLLQQDGDKYYVGVFVSRKITVTISDINFATIHPDDDDAPLERPVSYITPTLTLDSGTTSTSNNYTAAFYSNVNGTLEITDGLGRIYASNISVTKNVRATVNIELLTSTNNLIATITPLPSESQGLGEYEELSSYEPVSRSFTVKVNRFGYSSNALYVSPTGSSSGDGTEANPLDIYTATAYAQAGQEIILKGGTYNLNKGITIERGHNGTAGNRITLMSAPGEYAILDLSNSSSGGITLKGDYWHIYNIEICNSQSGKKPMLIQGHHNIVEKVVSHSNGDTGFQISGFSSEPFSMWPSYNQVISCVSYDNCDALRNDADGFAAKLTCGDGNVFKYCIAYNNIDDGYDLYAKSTSGSIGAVTIDSCIAYNNGWLTTDAPDAQKGEGNGFKLGGESMPGQHILINSISYGNLAKGITSNSGPDCKIFNSTSYNNGTYNFQLYTSAATSNYDFSGVISYLPTTTDAVGYANQSPIISTTNYLNGINSQSISVAADWFVSLDTSIIPTIAADGSINMHGLLELTENAPSDAGARISANPNPTVINIGTPVGTTTPGGGGSAPSEPQISGDSGTKGWAAIEDKIKETAQGGKITIDMKGTTTVPKSVLEAIKGKDIDLVLAVGGGTWTINGKDIENGDLKDVDLSVNKSLNLLPASIVDKLRGGNQAIQLHLYFSGKFRFKATFSFDAGSSNSGKHANLFYYNPTTKQFEYVSSGKIGSDGKVGLDFDHASDYVVVISDEIMTVPASEPSNEPAENPKTGNEATSTMLIIMTALALTTAISIKKKALK